MIDEYNADATGWARFSDDRRHRYRLSRILDTGQTPMNRVVFLMVNPSTADAFKLDPTVSKCCQFAARWGAHAIEVVNLFAFRSTDPKGLDLATRAVSSDRWRERLGSDEVADLEIVEACRAPGVVKVIAAWGNNGTRHGRDVDVRRMLAANNIPLWHLGLTADGVPKHPLARGKSFIPLTQEPVRWA